MTSCEPLQAQLQPPVIQNDGYKEKRVQALQKPFTSIYVEVALLTYGYIRISTQKQNLERQRRNIKSAYPEAQIVEDTYTGSQISRPGWDRLRKRLAPGDTIVFDSVSRMSRDAAEGFATYEDLYHSGINLVFLREPYINTETYTAALQSTIPATGSAVDLILDGVNSYLLALAKDQIRMAFLQSEKEVDDLRSRTKEGIQTAKLHGKQIGRQRGTIIDTKKSVAAKKIIRKHAKEFGGSLSDVEVIRLAKISRNSYYKYKRELKQQLAGQTTFF